MFNKLLKIQLKSAFGDKEPDAETRKFISMVKGTYNNILFDKMVMEAINEKMIHDLNASNNELQQLNESLDSFNYHVSHDLKTSFMNTKGLTQMLEKYLARNDTDKLKEIIVYLQENASQSLRSIDQFLEISKVNHDLIYETLEPCYLPGIVSATIFSIPELDEDQVTIIQQDFDTLYFHEVSIRSLFLNVLSNASKYRDHGRKLKIEIRFISSIEGPVVTIKDNGIGMDLKTDENSAFQLFKRLPNSRGIPGNGVGLFLVKKIMELNKGAISLFSEEHVGTEVHLKFSNDAIR